MSLLPSIPIRRRRGNRAADLGPRMVWKSPPFIKDVVVLDHGKNRIMSFSRPILFESKRTDSASGERLARNHVEGESILGRTARMWGLSQTPQPSPPPAFCATRPVVADAFLSDFQLQELLNDYKRFFMKRLEKCIVHSSSHADITKTFDPTHARFGSVDSLGAKPQVSRAQRQLEKYRSAVVAQKVIQRKTYEVVDVLVFGTNPSRVQGCSRA